MPIRVKQLKEHPCFRELTEDQLRCINPSAKITSFPPGRKLLGEGKPGDYLY